VRRFTAYGAAFEVDDRLEVDDVCCGAGLAADGLVMAGLSIRRGVDIEPQPHYPYPLLVGDALDYLRGDRPKGAHALYTGFPCQGRTRAGTLRTAQGGTARWPDILDEGVDLLRTRWTHKPWVVENVDSRSVFESLQPRPGEHLVRLCGSTFGLGVRRHRWFLANFPLRQPACRHDVFDLDPVSGKPRPWGVYHVAADEVPQGGRTARDVAHGRQVMGVTRPVPWGALKEGVPPHFAAHIGADLRAHLANTAAVSERTEAP